MFFLFEIGLEVAAAKVSMANHKESSHNGILEWNFNLSAPEISLIEYEIFFTIILQLFQRYLPKKQGQKIWQDLNTLHNLIQVTLLF